VALAAGQTPAGAQSPQDVLISLPSYPAAGEARRWRINDSQWGYIARFDAALAERLSACSDAEGRVAAALRLFPHRFTIDSIHGLEQLEACDPHARFGAGNGEVTVAAWTYVTGGAPLPSVMERARAIVFRRSADTPDYDMTLWDLERP